MIIVVGFMGAGKTSVGRALAAELGLGFVDTDEVIERRAGASIAEIFEAAGEAAFRTLESDVVAEVLGGPDAVVALGGGALEDPVTLAALSKETVVALEVTLETALARVGGGSERPMLARSEPAELYARRRPLYAGAAALRVDAEERSPAEIAADVARRLRGEPRRVAVSAPGGRYDVVVGPGAGDRLAALLPELPGAEKAFVITHPALAPAAAEIAAGLGGGGLDAAVIEVPDGEGSKTLAEAGRLLEVLAAAAAHRDDVVIGLGGGVVTDLAGFVASIYARGIPVVHIPTTLVGQVDAAIGGKTGVNLPHGKNLVGTFHQPALVVCDVRLMDGLPEAEVRAGLAEVVKYGFISDPGILELVERRAGDILSRREDVVDEIVYRCAAIKAEIVSGDERERGRRAVLNYGHTFAHAIEHGAGYGGIRHGEAVAIGMMAAAYLARELGRIDDGVVELHRRVLGAAGLPVWAPLDPAGLEAAWKLDKKYRGGVRFVLLAAPGRAEVVAAPPEAVAAALDRFIQSGGPDKPPSEGTTA